MKRGKAFLGRIIESTLPRSTLVDPLHQRTGLFRRIPYIPRRGIVERAMMPLFARTFHAMMPLLDFDHVCMKSLRKQHSRVSRVDSAAWFSSTSELHERQDIENRVMELIEEKVRPHAQADGGDVIFRSMDHENGIVHVSMKGACVSCSSSTITLKFMVLRLLQHYIEEVKDVEGHDEPCDPDDVFKDA